jgi:acyl-CoA thioester hydrolase
MPPVPYKICLQYEVPYADTDRMGVVYYGNYLVYFERARTRLLGAAGCPYLQLEREGFALPVVEAHVQYKRPAGYGDILDISGWSDWMKGTRLRVRCEVHRQGELLASGYTIHACIDLASRRPVPLPRCLTRLYADGVLAAPAAGARAAENSCGSETNLPTTESDI